MESTDYNSAEPIVNEIRELNKYITIMQAGVNKMIATSPVFPDNAAYMKTQATSFLSTANTSFLTQLQNRVTTLDGLLDAV